MKIIYSSGCSNSPKNKFIETYSINLVTKNMKELQKTSDNSISIVLTDASEQRGLEGLIDIEWDGDTLSCLSSTTHGRHGAFLGLISKKDAKKYISIHYEFKTLKAEKIVKVTLFESNIDPQIETSKL